MKNKPIIIVSGEPKSIFLEIFIKALKKKKYKSPIILICCKKILANEIGDDFFNKKINILDKQNLKNFKIHKDKLNLIDIECKKSNNKFNKKLIKSYLVESFDFAIKLIKENLSDKLINGPINKKTFLNKKTPGITEYISKKCKIQKTGMLIYNKKLSVCPTTTHIPLKLVASKITKKLIEEKIQIIDFFYRRKLKIKPKIGVAGMNPHCESFLKINEDNKIV
jgi:4-hydroxy-L-threonine phosphate dehydrogenase PdxA